MGKVGATHALVVQARPILLFGVPLRHYATNLYYELATVAEIVNIE